MKKACFKTTVNDLDLGKHYKEVTDSIYFSVTDGLIHFKPQTEQHAKYLVYDNYLWAASQRGEENLNDRDKNALYLYTTPVFQKMNLQLLSGDAEYEREVHEINQAIIHARQSYLPFQTYRIAHYTASEYELYTTGSTIYSLSFTSTSRKILSYWKGNTLMVFNLVKGKRVNACDVVKYSAKPEECEVVLAINSPLKVVGKGSRANNYKGVEGLLKEEWKVYEYILILELMR
jgi:hypothetical protein